MIILLLLPPPPNFQSDFRITNLADVDKIHPRPEYIFTGDVTDARVALKNISDCVVLSPRGRNNSDYIYNTFMNHLSELRKVYESLIDEESKKTFCGYWLGSITGRFGYLVHSNKAHYLTAGFIPEPGAIVIDGGAFDGRTAKLFTDMGYKVYAFEMDKENFEVAKKLAAENNFTVENFGLGSFKHEIKYNPRGASSRENFEGSETAQITTIDSYVLENNLPRVDFIKLDVEGAELETLRGAKRTIARWKPILAISAYHKWDDFWTLMNFVKSIRSDYEWTLGQCSSTSFETCNADNDKEKLFNDLGLEPELRTYWECCFMAR